MAACPGRLAAGVAAAFRGATILSLRAARRQGLLQFPGIRAFCPSAAAASAGEGPAEPSPEELARWVAALPETDKHDCLLRAMRGKPYKRAI